MSTWSGIWSATGRLGQEVGPVLQEHYEAVTKSEDREGDQNAKEGNRGSPH